MKQQIALGRKVVVEAAHAQVRGPRRVPHRDPARAALEDERRDRIEDLPLPEQSILMGPTRFSERHRAFL
jgi:hypothetical protein